MIHKLVIALISRATPATGLALTLACFACSQRELSVDRQARQAIDWPQAIAGRRVQVVADHFVLYARDRERAQRLAKEIDDALLTFASRYDVDLEGTGLIVAIEPGDEPISAIEEWRTENIDRTRVIVWTSSIRNQYFRTDAGRPYSLFRHAYFRESCTIPMAELIAIDGFEGVPLTAAWVCLLTTDEHVIAAFDDELRKYKREAREQAAQVPVLVRLLSAGAEVIFLAAAELVYPKCRSIDLQLMHLQRQETLWRTILEGTIADESQRARRIATLQEEIDDAWKDKWVRRPFD